jgi:hypothetical protein
MCAPFSVLGIHFAQNCGNSHESSEIVKRRLPQIFSSTLRTRWPAYHFALHHEHLFVHLWTFCTIVLQFLHSLNFGHKPCIIYDGFLHHSFLVWKWITARTLYLAGVSIAGHIITHSVETRKNSRWPVIWWFTRQWVMWRYLEYASSPSLWIFGNYYKLWSSSSCSFPHPPLLHLT